MAIRFEEKGGTEEPAKREVGINTYVAEEPAASLNGSDAHSPVLSARVLRPANEARKGRRT